MTTTIGLDSNIDRVISDVEDVQSDVRKQFSRKVGNAVRMMWKDALSFILSDPHVSGELMAATEYNTDHDVDLEFAVEVNRRRAEYAAVVEYGSGDRLGKSYKESEPIPKGISDAKPADYPYHSPNIDYNEDAPQDTEEYRTFYGFVKHIEDWMRTKPVLPQYGNYFVAASYIAATIVEKGNYAHPFLRPAYFENERKIKQAAENARRAVMR